MKSIVTLVALGITCVVTGVYLLAGMGWALIAAGVPCFGVALVLIRGTDETPGGP